MTVPLYGVGQKLQKIGVDEARVWRIFAARASDTAPQDIEYLAEPLNDREALRPVLRLTGKEIYDNYTVVDTGG